MQAHKYYLAAVSDIFKSLFFGREVAPSSCQPEAVGNNDIYDSTPPAETKELRTFFPGHIELGDRLGDYSKAVISRDYVISDKEGVENVNIACSSVDAFKVIFFLLSLLAIATELNVIGELNAFPGDDRLHVWQVPNSPRRWGDLRTFWNCGSGGKVQGLC